MPEQEITSSEITAESVREAYEEAIQEQQEAYLEAPNQTCRDAALAVGVFLGYIKLLFEHVVDLEARRGEMPHDQFSLEGLAVSAIIRDISSRIDRLYQVYDLNAD